MDIIPVLGLLASCCTLPASIVVAVAINHTALATERNSSD
jgi:hypothetical protein